MLKSLINKLGSSQAVLEIKRQLDRLVEVFKKNELWVMLVLVTIILFVRKTDAFYYPQFWAEDGKVFFAQAYGRGLASLLETYAGYLHLVPRIVALISAVVFPPSLAPAVYNYASLLATLLVVINLYSPRFDFNRKALLALAIVLVPQVTNEVFMNITNLQWILALAILITLQKKEPNLKYGNVFLQSLGDHASLILFGLTGPFLLMLWPVALVGYFRKKGGYSLSLLVVAMVIAMAQVYFLLNTANIPISVGAGPTPHPWVEVFTKKAFGNLFLGTKLPYHLPLIASFIGSVAVLGAIVMIALKARTDRELTGGWIYFMLVVSMAVVYKFHRDPMILLPPPNGPRYFYLPYVMIAWSLISILGQKERWKMIFSYSCLLCILISSLMFSFHSRPLIDYHWSYHSSFLGKKKHLIIPINPIGWTIEPSDPPL